jgi:hypothetical protein
LGGCGQAHRARSSANGFWEVGLGS